MVWVLQLLLVKVEKVNRAADEAKSVKDSENLDEDDKDGDCKSSFIDDSNSDEEMDGTSDGDEYQPASQETELSDISHVGDVEMSDG
ncbi:MAG: hypothetical protein M1815_000930 [Lichina confinis]|nr:MAG: hypothetical protein M1815_000930 [Lichina confinis]